MGTARSGWVSTILPASSAYTWSRSTTMISEIEGGGVVLTEVVDRNDAAALPVGAMREQARGRRLEERDLPPPQLGELAPAADVFLLDQR